MQLISINYWAVVVAALAYMALGALWYSSALFGAAWMKGIGKTKEQVTADFSPVNLVLAFIGSFLVAYGVARITVWSGRFGLVDVVITSLVIGICFVLPAFGINDIFEKRPRALTALNILYHLVGLIIIGVVIGVWR